MNPICERIKTVRQEYCLTQTELAKRLGVTNAHISKIEKGKTVPSSALIKLICKELGLNEQWLISGIPPMLIEEIEDEHDLLMTDSTKKFNKILKSSSPSDGLTAALLFRRFADLIDTESLDDSTKKAYLEICSTVLNHLEEYARLVKDSILERQILFAEFDITTACEEYANIISEDLRSFMELYKKSL